MLSISSFYRDGQFYMVCSRFYDDDNVRCVNNGFAQCAIFKLKFHVNNPVIAREC